MKINSGQFTDSYFPIMDGVGMTAHNYSRWLNEKYGSTCLIAPKIKGYTDNESYKVYRFKSVLVPGMNPYRIGLPLFDVSFKKNIRNLGFDLIHAHCPFISGYEAANLSGKLDVPLIAHFHSKYRDDFMKVVNNELFADMLLKIILDFYKSADLVWVPNMATGKTLEEYGFNGNYEIMPNGTDMPLPGMDQLRRLRNKGRRKLDVSEDDFVMLFVGQHRWEKNVRLILDSLHSLKQRGRAFRMVFVGEGYASGEMKKIVRETDLVKQVEFMGVISDRNELQQLYAASDLFVFPSVYDNSPLVIQEAAACGVPSIVVRNSSTAEGITDGINGFLVDANTAGLTSRIRDLMDQRTAIQIAGEGARKSIYHPWESIVDNVYTRYTEIVKSYKSKI